MVAASQIRMVRSFIARAGTEGNFQVTLTWHPRDSAPPPRLTARRSLELQEELRVTQQEGAIPSSWTETLF